MIKKIFNGLIAGGALLGMVASAQATTYELNIYGASAQHKFWLNLAPEWLTSATGANCSAAVQAAYNKKHGVAKGTGCVDGDDTVIFRYSSRSSMTGVNAVYSGASKEMADEDTCNWTAGTCTDLKDVTINLGASDVSWNEFNQSTEGYPDGNLSNDVFAGDPTTSYPSETRPSNAPDAEFQPIIVPFGFVANNTVCKFRCVKPHVWSDTDGNQIAGPVTSQEYAELTTGHKAYSHDMWQCDPRLTETEVIPAHCSDPAYTTEPDCTAADEIWTPETTNTYNPQCKGYFKCIDNVCRDGNEGTPDQRTCTTAADCPDADDTETRCEAMPIDNINHTMIGQIFSGSVTMWKDFGPYYDCKIDADGDGSVDDDQYIFAAMRHAGSGTHATMFDLMKPYNLATNDAYLGNLMVGDSAYPQGYNRIHYESSSDLTAAVIDFAGGIGYVDADKLLGFKDITDGMADGPTGYYDEADGIVGAHLVKYNGVEPTRQKIVNCEYEFWSPQHCYYMNAAFSGQLETLRASLEAFSKSAANLTEANLGNAANFWAAQSEAKCKKETVDNVTKKKIVRGSM